MVQWGLLFHAGIAVLSCFVTVVSLTQRAMSTSVFCYQFFDGYCRIERTYTGYVIIFRNKQCNGAWRTICQGRGGFITRDMKREDELISPPRMLASKLWDQLDCRQSCIHFCRSVRWFSRYAWQHVVRWGLGLPTWFKSVLRLVEFSNAVLLWVLVIRYMLMGCRFSGRQHCLWSTNRRW